MNVASFLGVLGVLGFVLTLLVITLKLLKRYAPFATGANQRVKLEVVQRLSLGPRQSIAVVRIGASGLAAAALGDSGRLRVGQLGKLLAYLEKSGTRHAVMAGQIAPKNLFDLRPDFKALFLLARLKRRNAETIFAAIGEEMKKIGVELIPAMSFMEEHLAPAGLIAGPKIKPRVEDDLRYGHDIAKEVSRLDIGQTVLVKNGTVLAVEAFEGTNDCIKRGGALGRGDAVMVKVSKPDQDLRFDVPVIGPVTLETCRDAGVRVIGIEAGRTIILERDRVTSLAAQYKLSIHGL